MRSQHTAARGFSVIELVLTLTIIALMTATYISVADFTGNALDRAARRLESDLRYAQQLSTAEEVNFGVITNNATTYTVYRINTATPTTDPHTRQPMTLNFVNGYAGISFGANYQVEFDPLGRPIIGGGTQFVLIHPAGNQRTVTVTATTGYVQVQ